MAGRPSRYSKALGDRICAQLAQGKSLRTVCEDPKMPDKSTIFRWLRMESMTSFRDQYAQAKKESADAMAEELMDIADDALAAVEKVAYEPRLASAVVQAHKLKADNLKWTMARQQPKKYGEKSTVTVEEDEEANPFVGLDEATLRILAGKKKRKNGTN